MFGKKCHQCGKKVKSKHQYCPYCGSAKSQEELQQDFGLLGAHDSLPFGFNFLVRGLMKELDKQLRKADSGEKIPFQEGVSIHIALGGKPEAITQKSEAKRIRISEEMVKKLSFLPREEAETSVRRMSQKIVYEIALPGVQRLEDIIISRLESSIEIKAIAPDKVFFKLIPLNSPLLGYGLKDGKLVMEFKS